MATSIQIKRGTGSGAPGTSDLIEGELAYAEDRSNNGASAKLYISSINSSSAEVIDTIGGKYYTAIIDGATNANTASKLVERDGSGNFSAGTITAALTGNSSTATEATNVTVTANNSTDETVYPLFVDGVSGTQGAETDSGLTYYPSTGLLTSAGLTASGTVQWGSLSDGAITVTAFVDEDNMSTSPLVSTVSAITINASSQNITEFVCTSNQTTFSITYVAGAILVFLNGVLLDNGVDYTATNGTSIVLVNGAAADDVLTVDKGNYTFTAAQPDTFATASEATALAIALG